MKRAALLSVWVLGLSLIAGCVQRRMTVISDPPGAKVIVNGHDLGAAPVDVPSNQFIYYGNYEILLLKDGYEPLLVNQGVPPPWYEWFPLDFISENLLPHHLKDRRIFTYELQPTIEVPPAQVFQNADAQRARGQTIGCPPELLPPGAIASPPPAQGVESPGSPGGIPAPIPASQP
jgi:hypothetical protein